MKLLGYRIAPTALMALAIFGSAAQGGTIVQTDVVAQTATDFTNSMTFNKFNPAAGTLTSVVVAITATGDMSGSLQNTADTPQSFTFTETTDLHVGAFPNAVTFLPVLAETQAYTNLAGGGTAPFGPFSPSDGSQGATYTAAPDLSDYKGTGTFNVPISTATGESFVGGGGNVLANLVTTAGLSVTVTYNYTPNGVPEPASFVLAGLGAVGLAVVARRRRKA